jgi:hypothetical protein
MHPAHTQAHQRVQQCLQEEMGRHADKRMHHLVIAPKDTMARLTYWFWWHESCGLWMTPAEKDVFLAAMSAQETFSALTSKDLDAIRDLALDDAYRDMHGQLA